MHHAPETTQPPRVLHLFNAIGALLMIVWEMQTRFNIGLQKRRA